MINEEKLIIDLLFESRMEAISIKNEEDKKRIFEITRGKDTYEEIKKKIEALLSESDKEEILNSIDEHCNKLSIISGYENQKFYKAGFKDGINIIVESLGGINNVK